MAGCKQVDIPKPGLLHVVDDVGCLRFKKLYAGNQITRMCLGRLTTYEILNWLWHLNVAELELILLLSTEMSYADKTFHKSDDFAIY